MTYEHEIPDYAMMPARERAERVITLVGKGAVYAPLQVTNITEKPKTTITVEEDILVPDTKPDLREILLIDGCCRLTSREVDQLGKNDDYVPISGEIQLQTLYRPEKQDMAGPIIAAQTKVPFKEQWHIALSPGATLILDCQVEHIDYMVINERKYRVRITLAIYAREYSDRQVELFEGITGEDIQMCKELVEITNVALRKKDVLAIREDIQPRDDCPVETILKQNICVVENYKQVTGEKVVVNGFVHVNMLYTATQEESLQPGDDLRQLQERVEFTQFIPIQAGGPISGSKVTFDGSDLKVKLVQDEELGEVIRLEGDIVAYVELYRNLEKEFITDAYHREKDFLCDFTEEQSRTLIGSTVGEASGREILSPENLRGDMERILYTVGHVQEVESRSETGKIITEGTVLVKTIGQSREPEAGEELQIFAVEEAMPFRVVTAVPQVTGGEIICDQVYIKDLWAEKINGKQLECNLTVMVVSEILRPAPFQLLTNPAFEESTVKETAAPMVVYITTPEDTLWSIAKKFKSTTDTIAELNGLEGGRLEPGTKLLVLK